MISLKKGSKVDTQKDFVLLANASTSFEDFGFNPQEIKWIQSEIKNEKPQIVLNSLGFVRCISVLRDKKTPELTLEACRLCGPGIVALFHANKIEKLQLIDGVKNQSALLALAEGIVLSSYQFLKYRKNKKTEAFAVKELKLIGKGITDETSNELQNLCEGVFKARDLVNEPLSYLTAEVYSKEVKKIGKEAGFHVEVLNKAKIEALKMGGLLAVNKGSIDPPTFTIMEYKPAKAVNKNPIVLVGKGVVYDTGGLSLKPTDGMVTMKCDMAGAAAVAGAMYAIAKSELPVWVVGLCPATDNRPSGNAIVPGDIITISDGTTVEVLNTDAEGRLILSDALVYAKKYKPQIVIDLATLTGVAARTIGRYGIVAMGNNEDDLNTLSTSGHQVHERLVVLPLWDDYGDLIKSDIADLKNIGGMIGGANTAGKFLEHFTDYPWIHLDIAGPAFNDSPDNYRGKGGTGSGVRLLVDFVKQQVKL